VRARETERLDNVRETEDRETDDRETEDWSVRETGDTRLIPRGMSHVKHMNESPYGLLFQETICLIHMFGLLE